MKTGTELHSSKFKYLHHIILSSFAKVTKKWNTSSNEIQTFDVVNLCPSIPINKAVALIIEILINKTNDLRK